MMCAMRTPWFIAATFVLVLSVATFGQVKKAEVPGITNFSRVDATVGCGGATAPAAMAGVEEEGVGWGVNLRVARGTGAGGGGGPAPRPGPRAKGNPSAF